MQIRDRKDFVLGSACVAVGAAFALTASGYHLGTASKMGPGYFPFVLGSLLVVAGAVIAARSLGARRALRKLDPVALKAPLLVLGSICLFAVLFDDVGLVIGNLGQGIEAVDGGEDLTAFLREQRLGGAPDRLAVVDHEYLQPRQTGAVVARR